LFYLLEIRSVEHGICLTAKSTMNELESAGIERASKSW